MLPGVAIRPDQRNSCTRIQFAILYEELWNTCNSNVCHTLARNSPFAQRIRSAMIRGGFDRPNQRDPSLHSESDLSFNLWMTRRTTKRCATGKAKEAPCLLVHFRLHHSLVLDAVSRCKLSSAARSVGRPRGDAIVEITASHAISLHECVADE